VTELASLTIGQLVTSAAGWIVLASVFVEITPVKINPVSSFLKWLGKKLNTDTAERLDNLEKRDIIDTRYRILRFGDEVRRKERHSREHFDQILSDIDDYEKYCEGHKDFKNSKTQATTARILEVYQQCIREDDFL
jgi:hypothetical protein